ncbi:BTAD domain-containing putative transcriptional regulator [Mycobacterium sp. 94-17]|uniref:BTAD domain-containing putative transcriptional regulator n=1 Tax=Mycobacterium sp. 94-17 TaxID=2986147 RepID=UPI002D1E74F0|nr:BTAD domain-containing putative transcriptional regulator [Mycobacterium sp. 94-17]MEB4210215.1 BTAD domain-containing putative transcriptional regulator [Mycobacterium sp. 94-17]
MADQRLTFGLLGPVQMSVDGALVPLGTPKQRAVLAMLLINRNNPVGVDRLIGALWDESPPSGARAGIHSYVSNLRRLLTGAGVDPRTTLVAAPPGYRLNIGEDACDVGRFIAEKTAGVHAAAAGRFEQAGRHLSAALAEWRGPVLEDLDDFRFVDAFAASLAEEKILAHTAQAEAEIACGRAYTVIAELEGLTAEHPYREQLWAQLMTAYYLTDRQSEALAAYRRVQKSLADDLGIDPGPNLRALNDRILRQEPLDAKKNAMTTAAVAITVLEQYTCDTKTVAFLHETSGRSHPLQRSTTIGRLGDNDIVLDSPKVSRHHAVIVDTGSGYVIEDLRSSNGVHVRDQRIGSAATLRDGDRIRICDREFTFRIAADNGDDAR